MSTQPPPRRAAIVLAGGRSSRMGREKAGLPFGPETLLERVARLASPLVDEVIVVAREGQDILPVPGARFARDSAEGNGPLAGLVAGFETTTAPAALVLGCDHPFLHAALVEHLFESLAGHECVVVQAGSRLAPLCAVYARALLPAARARLARGDLRLAGLVESADVVVLDEPVARRFDPDLASLRNCNTPADYAAALRDAGFASVAHP